MNYEEFKKVMEVTEMDEETKTHIIEHSKVFFEFQSYMMEKHNISGEVVESMAQSYIQSRLTPESELFKRFMKGDDGVLSELYQQFATEQWFEESIVESMNTFMQFYKNQKS
jgi:heme oxygenase